MSNPQDIEMQVPAPAKSLAECQQRLQDLMLEGISKVDREHVDIRPVLQGFDRRIQTWPKEDFFPALAWLNITTDAVTCQDIYEYICRVIVVLNHDMVDNVSMNYIWKEVVAQEKSSSSESDCQRPDPETVISLQRLTLATLGLLTMLFHWTSQSSVKQLSVLVTTAKTNARKNQMLRSAVARATGSMIRNFDCLPSAIAQKADQTNLLYLSSLNLASLVDVGKIRIEWTDQLGSHLLFDPSLRTLKLFKFPSFCATIAQKSSLAKVFENILAGHNEADDDDKPDDDIGMETKIQQEILLSLRVILGQTRKSRKLFLRQYFPMIDAGQRDRLLNKLGGSGKSPAMKLPPCYWPKTLIGENKKLNEQDVYNTWTDFPILGKRLLVLQTWNTRQQPSTVRDIWRDRRSPGTWLAFWAVLIFGGISTLLTILQLGIAAAQLAIALPPASLNRTKPASTA